MQQPPKKWMCHSRGWEAFSKTPCLSSISRNILEQAEKEEGEERRNFLARKGGFLSAARGTGGGRAAAPRPQQEELLLYEGSEKSGISWEGNLDFSANCSHSDLS